MMIMIPILMLRSLQCMRIDPHVKNILDWYTDQLVEQQPWVGGMVCYAANPNIFADALYS